VKKLTKAQADKLMAAFDELDDVQNVTDALSELCTDGESEDREEDTELTQSALADWLDGVRKVVDVAEQIGLRVSW